MWWWNLKFHFWYIFEFAAYSAKCNYCGKIFKATYWPFLISKASAKVACEGKLHNHIINSHYGNL